MKEETKNCLICGKVIERNRKSSPKYCVEHQRHKYNSSQWKKLLLNEKPKEPIIRPKNSFEEKLHLSDYGCEKFVKILEIIETVKQRYDLNRIEATLYAKANVNEQLTFTDTTLKVFLYDRSKVYPLNYIGCSFGALERFFECTKKEAIAIIIYFLIEVFDNSDSLLANTKILMKTEWIMNDFHFDYHKTCIVCKKEFDTTNRIITRCKECINKGKIDYEYTSKPKIRKSHDMHPCARCGVPVPKKYEFCLNCREIKVLNGEIKGVISTYGANMYE